MLLYLKLLLVLPVVSPRGLNAVSRFGSRSDPRHDSCKLRPARQIADSPIERSSTESFVLDDTEYKICRYRVTWDEALVFCSSHKAHLATLDTEEKTAFVVRAIASSNSVSEDYWIGARKYYRDPWTWNSNGRELSFERNLISNIVVWYPGYESSGGHCLTIDRSGHDAPIFISRDCNQQRPFICQRDNERTIDNKIRMVASSRIGGQEFRLYSGRVTWAEAVVHCRQEGLQIGEVRSVEEAQALAFLMLRNRPDGIESAWIGGYTRKDEPGTWRWLASGNTIETNAMWRENFTDSVGGCLLLDRHVCETPVYVGTTCDRKRDVLCQKPAKKRVSKYPVAVMVEDRQYWIGFHPLAWSDAKRSCGTVNASLVVLDSPNTIAHMMNLMLTNRAELRHIWTDGILNRTGGRWQWGCTGERIPDFAESFLPWCPNDGYYSDETECLNLDRENLDTPLVYALPCTEKQPYVCQPHIGSCVFHSPPTTTWTEGISRTMKFTPPFYEDSGSLPMSKVTAPYPTAKNYEALQTTIDGEHNHLTNLLQWNSAESVAEKNSSTDHLRLTEYLKTLSGFTLPSLPQFGIKVVSAAEVAPTTRPTIESKRKKTKNHPAMDSSFYGTTPSILRSTTLTALTTSKKIPVDIYRESSSRLPVKSTNSSVTILAGHVEPMVSSYPINTTIANVSSKTLGNSVAKLTHAGKSSNGNSTSTAQAAATATSSQPDAPSSASTLDDSRAKTYSVKTTRDLSPTNSTRIASTVTTKAPDPTSKSKPVYSFRRTGGVSSIKDFKDTQPKPVIVESFPVNAARPNTTLVPRRRQKIRTTTTEATPYDAIDADYYNYEAVEESPKVKANDEDSRENSESNEYSDDYETATTSGKPQTKKTKQTSSSSVRKIHTTAKTFRRMKGSKDKLTAEEIDDGEEETAEDADENEGSTTATTAKSVPIAAELSKNLEAALVNMMRQSVERRKNDKAESVTTAKNAGERETNSSAERNAKGSKTSTNVENWSLRPYYGFEGPMIMALSDDSNLGGEVESTGEKGSGKMREFKLIGKMVRENRLTKSLEADGSIGNETRRRMKSPVVTAGNGSPVRTRGMSMPGLPVIQPNDPNSLVQLGRYFKEKFSVLESDGRLNLPAVDDTRDDRSGNDHRRYQTLGTNARPRLRYRMRTGTREDEARNSAAVAWEKKRRPLQESDSNYYDGRRLYPRGYDFYGSSMRRRSERQDEDPRRDEEERLGVAWPEKKASDSASFYGYDERTRVVSPRTYAAPIRTTRSFHEAPAIRKVEPSRFERFPDFGLSKLVKEVKIDLDQRLLRRYLEGFAKKMSRRDNGRADDWKTTWRQLLGQMLTILDRMNINVNGDLVKVRVGSDHREDERASSSAAGHSGTLNRRFNPRKQRKDSLAVLEHSLNQVPRRTNGNSSEVDRRRVSPNSLENGNDARTKDSGSPDGGTTDSYRRYAYGESATKSPVGDQRDAARRTQPVLPEANVLRPANNARNAAGSSGGEGRTARPSFDHQFTPRQVGNDLQRGNWFQPKYGSFNDSSMIVGSPPSLIPRISTVFGYQPVIPQLHHRILFPGWSGIRVVDRINPAGERSPVLRGEYLARGTLSRIVGSEHENEHFGRPEHRTGKSTTSNPRPENASTSPRSSLDREIPSRAVNESGMENRRDEGWRRAGERPPGRNGYRNEYYERYLNETEVRTRDNDRGDTPEEEASPREDYERKPVWSPAHHLTKALELSLLRKFGASSSNSLRSKNVVARSAKDSESEAEGRAGDEGGREIEESFEGLKEEPSIVGLRMTMDPEKSSRATRQSRDSRVTTGRRPRTLALRVSFAGREERASSVREKIEADRTARREERGESPMNETLGGLSTAGRRASARAPKRRSRGFVHEDRRRALMNRLRERSRASHSARPNGIPSARDRKSRTIAARGKHLTVRENSSKVQPVVKHHIATVVRSFDDEIFRGRERNEWRGDGARGKEFGVDWTGQAAALFTDLKESGDEFTLYVDLTLGRVGTKAKNTRSSRG